jgi:myo-inositol-1(or 4)-monophosphatase
MTLNLQATLARTVEIAYSVGDLLREGFALAQAQKLAVQLKSRFDPLTEYDQRAEAFIASELRRSFPTHGIIGEEGVNELAGARFEWHIDPIDGTHNFSHGVPWFCTSIGLVEAGVPLLGAVFDPINNRMFAAAQGHGATLNGGAIRVSPVAKLERSLLGTGFPTDRSDAHDNNFGHFLAFMQHCQDARRLGAAALDLCAVGSGWLDGYWQPQLHSYDVAAGIVIVREAGGIVTDFDGSDGMLRSGNVLASNGALHADMRRVLLP